MRRLIFPVLLGLLGCGILLSLSGWQLSRLGWKYEVLAKIEREIAAEPVALPPEGDTSPYLPVTVSGVLTGEYLEVLVSRKRIGAGHRVVAVLAEESGRRVLVDLGFVKIGTPIPPVGGPVRVVGNQHRPVEVDAYTPPPDLQKNLWFARDLPAMAQHFGSEETFVVARESVVPGIEAMPLDTSGIPNDHLQYAFTWGLLALVWAGMTGLLIWRIWQRKT